MAAFRRTVDRTVHNGRTNTYFTRSVLGSTTRIIDNINTELYVGYVPYTCTEMDLFSIFEQYGIIVDCYVKPAKPGQRFTWGLVQYDNRMDAELAVRDLDCRPPFNFYVTFSNSNEDKELHTVVQHGYSEPAYNHSVHKFRRRPLSHLADFVDEETYEDYEDFDDKELNYDKPHRLRNRITRPDTTMLDLKLVVNNDNHHQISEPKGTLGKCQPLRKTRKDILQAVERVISFKILGTDDTFGDNNAEDDGKSLIMEPKGRCKMCGIMSSCVCMDCQLAFYCGDKCQEKDWPNHKFQCAATKSVLNHVDEKKLEPSNHVMKKENDIEHSREYKYNQCNHEGGYTGRKEEGRFERLHDEKDQFSKNRHEERNSNYESRYKGFEGRNKFNESKVGLKDFKHREYGNDRNNGYEQDEDRGYTHDRNKSIGQDRNKPYENRNPNFMDRNKNFEDGNRGLGNDRGRGFGNKNRFNGNQKTDKKEFGPRESSWNKNSAVDSVKESEDSEFWDEKVQKSTPVCNSESSGAAIPSLLDPPKPLPLMGTMKVEQEASKPTPLMDTPKLMPLMGIKVAEEEVSRNASPAFFPMGVAKEIVITCVIDKGHYQVHATEMISDYQEMTILLNEKAKTAGPLNLAEKAKCIALSDQLWFRGIIKSVSPLLVNLVDFGSIERFKPDQLKAIPEEFIQFPKMGIRIKLAPNVDKEFYNKEQDDRLYVKPVSKDIDGAFIVEVVNSGTTSQKAVPSVKTTEGSSIENSSTKQKPSHDFLLRDVFSKVLLCLVHSETEFSVHRIDRLQDLMEIERSIVEELPAATRLTPVLNEMCIAEYMQEWFRGQITSETPLKVLFIDYGNEEICTVDQIRTISPKLRAWPPQAYKMRLAEGTTKAFSLDQQATILEVKPISEDKGVITVLLKGSENSSSVPKVVPSVTQPSQESEPSLPRPVQPKEESLPAQACTLCYLEKNVTDLLKEGNHGLLRISKCNSEKQFIVTVSCRQLEKLNDYVSLHLLQALKEQAYEESFRPKVNEVVGVELKEDGKVFWARAVQYLEGKYASCDTGLEVTPLQIKRITASYNALPHLAAFCELQNFKVPVQDIENKYFKVGNDIRFEVSKVDDDGFVLVNLKSENTDIEICDGVLDPWQPHLYIQKNFLKSDSRVFLSSFKSLDEFYVLFEQFGSFGFLSKFQEDIQTAPGLKSDPKIGTLVACLFSVDKEWYRAEILNKTDNGFQVYFVDYGNTEETTLGDLKSLPRRYRHIPYEAIKVGLANNVNKPLTESALDLLLTISVTAEPLKIIFENDLTSITLLRADGKNLNDQLNTMIDPNWKNQQETCTSVEPQEVGEESMLSLDSLPEYSLAVGTELDLMVLWIEDPRVIIVTEFSPQIFVEIDDLTNKLEKYCKSLQCDLYKPSEYELCAAVFDDKWYRALCLDAGNTESKVMFIDFGNQSTVDHSKIRKLSKDFVRTPARGCVCTYEAIPETCSQSMIERFNELFKPDNVYKIAVKKYEDGCYTIDVPSVTLTLQKEGFLQLA